MPDPAAAGGRAEARVRWIWTFGLGLLLVFGPGAALAVPRFTNTPVRAIVTVADKENAVLLAGRTDTELFYSPPNVPEGVYASIPLGGIQNVRLEFVLDEAGLNRAVAARRWREAAAILIKAIEPALPYVDLPGNDVAEAAGTASGYLLNAVAALPGDAATVKAQSEPLLKMVVRLSDAVQRAEWFYGAEAARLRAVQALTRLNQIEDADQLMEDAAVPEPGDGDFGLFWLAKATLAQAKGQSLESADAAARSLAFDNKNPETFGPALMLSARGFEERKEWHRARDAYFEISRLFRETDHGDIARERLDFIMKEGLTRDKEPPNLAKLFFGTEEDMDALAQSWLETLATGTNAPPAGAKMKEKQP
jgi:hypothetical protein